MGLTLSYSLLLESACREEVREKIGALRRLAADLPFKELGELVELEGDACRLQDDDPNERVKFGAMTLEDYGEIHKGEYAAVPSCLQLIGFRVFAGDGCSSCTFGLANHAANPTRWAWYDFCKTQYASNPDYGGLENFLRCHLALVRIIESAQELGLLEKANDPSDYFQNHDLEALVKCLQDYNLFTAATIGSVKDLLEPLGYTAQAPILERPDFERLEAQGRMPGGETSTPTDPLQQ